MMAPALRLALGAAFLLALEPSSARAGVDFPVALAVVGKGEPVRVVVSAVVRPSPCDAPTAKPLFDGMVPMGHEVSLVSPTACVCYRNASGYFRTKDLGAHQTACFPRFAGDTLPMRVVIEVK